MKLLLNLLEGFAVTRDVYVHPRKYERRLNGGFAADASALQGDVRIVGSDVKSVLEKQKARAHGQSADARSGTVTQR